MFFRLSVRIGKFFRILKKKISLLDSIKGAKMGGIWLREMSKLSFKKSFCRLVLLFTYIENSENRNKSN